MTSKKPFYHHKAFQLTVGIAVSVLCMWLALRPILNDDDAWDQLVFAFRTADYRTLPVIFIVLFIFYWLKAWRWRLMLAPIGQFRPVKDLLPPIMIGFSFNNLLPAHLGEFVRCFVFSKQQKVPVPVSISSVVLERVFDVIAILLYLGIGLIFIEGVDPSVKKSAYVFAGAAAALVLGGIIYVIWTKPFVNLVEKILKMITFIPHSLTDKLCEMLEAGAKGLASLKHGPLLFAIVVISIIKWALNGSLILLALWSFDISVSPVVAMVLLGVVAFGVTVPSSPGYFGVIQLCFMLVLELFVPNKPAIFAASVYYHMSQYIPVTLIGLIYFLRSGMSIAQVEEEKAEADEHIAAEVELNPAES
ncbi:hypothetical protein KOR42_28220 [Thalassoglobus neptunius]|uniref:Flippase-like domain-containing protein n=1 Tax=Thalassoglobus neptunius TaxID=1938619 RepID=A0A5C5WXI3_9PLAN|nr:lysylphosphatidylglycerol synthase transmembrane domain-containing protein [Thalassoglobus neptunius]TWT55436.1 hypothetical protein KOR42_28220 [Thalassoglobus neptunius]